MKYLSHTTSHIAIGCDIWWEKNFIFYVRGRALKARRQTFQDVYNPSTLSDTALVFFLHNTNKKKKQKQWPKIYRFIDIQSDSRCPKILISFQFLAGMRKLVDKKSETDEMFARLVYVYPPLNWIFCPIGVYPPLNRNVCEQDSFDAGSRWMTWHLLWVESF